MTMMQTKRRNLILMGVAAVVVVIVGIVVGVTVPTNKDKDNSSGDKLRVGNTPSAEPTSEPSTYPTLAPSSSMRPSESPSMNPSTTQQPSMAPSDSAKTTQNCTNNNTTDANSTIEPCEPPLLENNATLEPEDIILIDDTFASSAPSPANVSNSTTLAPTVANFSFADTSEQLGQNETDDMNHITNDGMNSSLLFYDDDFTTRFHAIGDVPYTDQEKVELELQIQNLEGLDFVIHVGDIRSAKGGERCVIEEYWEIASILNQSNVPVFLVVGDNEYNDCPNANQGLEYWRTVFGNFEDQWNHTLNVTRPVDRPENFAFVNKFTLFIGLNLVGGKNHHGKEWATRLQEQLDFVQSLVQTHVLEGSPSAANTVVIFGHANPKDDHEDFFVPLSTYMQEEMNNTVPFLYLNGDAHKWKTDSDFFGQSNFFRIQLEGGTKEPPLFVAVNSVGGNSTVSETFMYDRMLEEIII